MRKNRLIFLVRRFSLSLRAACRVATIFRTSFTYVMVPNERRLTVTGPLWNGQIWSGTVRRFYDDCDKLYDTVIVLRIDGLTRLFHRLSVVEGLTAFVYTLFFLKVIYPHHRVVFDRATVRILNGFYTSPWCHRYSVRCTGRLLRLLCNFWHQKCTTQTTFTAQTCFFHSQADTV